MRTLTLKTLLFSAGLAAFCCTAPAQDSPDPQQIRKQAKALLEEARDRKANGDLEASENLAQKAKGLRLKADRLEEDRRSDPAREGAADVREGRKERGPSSDRARPRQARPPQDRSPRNEDLDSPPSRTRADRDERADGRFENPRHRDDDRRGPELRAEERRFQEDRRGPRFPLNRRARVELAARRYHVQRAIQHLHAAGLHEQADRLQERLDQVVRRFEERRSLRLDRDGPPPRHSERRSDGQPEERP